MLMVSLREQVSEGHGLVSIKGTMKTGMYAAHLPELDSRPFSALCLGHIIPCLTMGLHCKICACCSGVTGMPAANPPAVLD